MAEGTRVLVIEDDDDSREMYELTLRQHRFAVFGARTARDGVDRGRELTFDVIVCDLGLPDGSGFDVVRDLRTAGQSAPAIALTGSSDDVYRERARAVGFAEFCVKPCPPAELIGVIRRVLGGNGER